MLFRRMKCRQRIIVICFYAIAVLFLEYLLIFQHVSSSIQYSDYDTEMQKVENSTATHQWDVRHLNQSEKDVYLVGLNVTNRNVTKIVINETWDKSELHLIQMRLIQCVQRKTDMLKCVEDEYVRKRKEFILEKMTEHGGLQPQKNPPKPPIPLPKVPVIHPTDNPEKLAKYYTRRDTKVNPFKFDFLIKPEHTCDNETYMIVLVHSFHPYKDRRQAIRNTWGGVVKGLQPWPSGTKINKKMKLYFILGLHQDTKLNQDIQNESEKFDDIIQGNFMDAYVNMTYKSLLGLKYVFNDCPSAHYLYKSDDDMIVNVPYLLDTIEERSPNRSIMGPFNGGSKVYRSGKWKVSHEIFPFIYYPPYEAGSGYLITSDIVRNLFETSEYVPQFHVDDVYITGVLGRILNVTHVKQKGFAFWSDRPPAVCDIILNKKITGTKMTPVKLEQMWGQLKKPPKC